MRFPIAEWRGSSLKFLDLLQFSGYLINQMTASLCVGLRALPLAFTDLCASLLNGRPPYSPSNQRRSEFRAASSFSVVRVLMRPIYKFIRNTILDVWNSSKLQCGRVVFRFIYPLTRWDFIRYCKSAIHRPKAGI